MKKTLSIGGAGLTALMLFVLPSLVSATVLSARNGVMIPVGTSASVTASGTVNATVNAKPPVVSPRNGNSGIVHGSAGILPPGSSSGTNTIKPVFVAEPGHGSGTPPLDVRMNAEAGARLASSSTSTAPKQHPQPNEHAAPQAFQMNHGRSLHLNASGVPVTEAVQVNSKNDFKAFIANMPLLHKSIAKVEVKEGSASSTDVTVVSKNPAKLFGFIPVNVPATTVVKASANASVKAQSHLPWWSFLTSGLNYNAQKVDTSLQEDANIKAQAEANSSALAQATMVQSIIARLQVLAGK